MHLLSVASLPPGYRVEWMESTLRLSGPSGELLAIYPAGPHAFATIEEHAWEHAWAGIETELRQEVRALGSRARAFAQLRRMKQYVRLIDAFAGMAPEMEAPVRRPEPLRAAPAPARRTTRPIRLVVAGGVAVAAGLLGFLLSSADLPAPPVSNSLPAEPEVVISTSPAQIAPAVPAVPPRAPVEPRQPTRIAGPARPATGYAVAFGRFSSFDAAHDVARSVRAKGYLATVVRVGRSFNVVGRVYATRPQAERMARILREIALPARVQAAGL